MRWVVFILLLLGAYFGATAFLPAAAGGAGWLRPFAVDTRSIAGFLGALPGRRGSLLTTALAGLACAGFAVAIVGLFWRAIPVRVWPASVLVAAAASLVLSVSFFSTRMIAPIAVDVLLAWGVATARWTAEALPVRGLQGEAARIHPALNIPVPWTYVLMFLAGVGLQFVAPVTIRSFTVVLVGRIAGLVVIAAGSLLAFPSLARFRKARTTTVPFETPSALVTDGAYRFTRNPMYVGLALIYIGVAATQVRVWPIVLLPLLVAYIDRVVIRGEESRLRAAFGEAYDRYCARVRRWL